MCMREMINEYIILVGKSEESRPLKRHRHRWEDNIKLDVRFIWLNIWASSGLFLTRKWDSRCHKMWKIPWPAERLLDSQEGLCSMVFVLRFIWSLKAEVRSIADISHCSVCVCDQCCPCVLYHDGQMWHFRGLEHTPPRAIQLSSLRNEVRKHSVFFH
jgi:hypothetical protein